MIHSFSIRPASDSSVISSLQCTNNRKNTLQNKEEKSVSATNYLLISVPKLQKQVYQELAGQTFRYAQAWIAWISRTQSAPLQP